MIDASLLEAWLSGRSLARGLPPPVADRGALRVDTRSASETARWVFAAPSPAVRSLAESLNAPGLLIKLCDSVDTLRAFLPEHWVLHAPGYFMMAGEAAPERSLPAGYHMRTLVAGPVACVEIVAESGELAASGHAAETGTAFVYDRIVTTADHRRKGLGGVVMQALRAIRRDEAVPQLLVATEEGRALYRSLGWTLLSDYSTGSIPSPPAGT